MKKISKFIVNLMTESGTRAGGYNLVCSSIIEDPKLGIVLGDRFVIQTLAKPESVAVNDQIEQAINLELVEYEFDRHNEETGEDEHVNVRYLRGVPA